MATEVKLPRLGQGMETGTIVRWLKGEGDPVKEREPLYELDTDKVTQEVEAETAGVLLKIVVTEGEVEVGTTIAFIGNEGEEVVVAAVTAKAPASPATAASGSEPQALPAGSAQAARALEVAPGTATVERPAGARVKASPLARRIARERGIELASVAGTGPEGRVIAEDVEKAGAGTAVASAAPVAAPLAYDVGDGEGQVEVVRLTATRRTIARRLTEAWAAPVFQLGVSVDMTEALHLREQLVLYLAEGDVKPTVGDLLTRLAGVALMKHRAVNATYDGETIQRHPLAHVGIAVAAPNGLVVPVVRDAGRSTIQGIAKQRADLVGRARDGKLKLEDMQGGTFTISNLGMYGVEQFVAVLNPPQVAILAVGAVKDTAVVVDGEVDVAPMLQMTLTCDHRAIDGADGADFLRTLVTLLEQPALAL
jgi:pyruvate dehydrogenase E2 component (dihydrolipoamide acetyltransferase)